MFKKPFYIYPFLFAIFPILFLFSHNMDEASFSVIWLPLAIALLMTLLFLLIFKLLLRDGNKAGILTSFSLIMIFSYGHILNLMKALHVGSFAFRYLSVQQQHLSLLLISSILFGLTLYILVKIKRGLDDFAKFLNIVAFSLILISLINIGFVLLSSRNAQRYQKEDKIEVIDSKKGISELRNIYYIIFDRYASVSTLKSAYDYDNTPFINSLAKRGFYIADKSVANYPVTWASLSSSLNLDYFDPDKAVDLKDAKKKLEENQVWPFLKAKGYKFIHFGSGWHPLSRNRYADVNFNYYFPDEFSMYLYENSLFYPILTKLFSFDRRSQKHARVLYTFDKLAQTTDMEEPVFVFVHFQLPHQPYTFDKNGNFISRGEEIRRGRKRAYLEQLIFANQKIIELIDKILADSKKPPIILLQSDEGPYPLSQELDGKFDVNKMTNDEIAQKMRIINAYYLPNINKRSLYPSISPVNSFRLVFNHYFDANFDLLPDQSYSRGGIGFIDVTNKVKYD
ncbi:MAG: LTA synthase family protein [Candidatus Margulisbacteria bacterium]|nr:LTA synthase family protein [Candidatus Margulisiibacteriota bacterium]MBU1021511.1 LTA synthase family protein [Candidatus Margulisiibacteriota bacterium]MBU1728596.1 LTA synthase family protein [Candidatus Margulisiibacteriota bacterium]MBU1955825.1 LTA synthase family protein [Candidatus Margulisiibacteriota bacterium]